MNYPKPNFNASTVGKVIPTAVNNSADYCSILADPFDEYKNARIPDECNLPSRVVALYQEGVLTANLQGCTGIYINCNKLGSSQLVALESAASTDAVIAFDNSTAIPGASTLSAAATRLVAAGVKIEAMMGDGYNGGTIYSLQKCRFESPAAPVASVPTLVIQRMNGFGPAKFGAFATYRPADTSDSDYTSVSSSVAGLQLHVSLGLYPATTVVPAATFKYKVVLHYEILPLVDTENGPGVLAYGPHDGRTSLVVDALARQIPPIGGGSESQDMTEMFRQFSSFASRYLSTAAAGLGAVGVGAGLNRARRNPEGVAQAVAAAVAPVALAVGAQQAMMGGTPGRPRARARGPSFTPARQRVAAANTLRRFYESRILPRRGRTMSRRSPMVTRSMSRYQVI